MPPTCNWCGVPLPPRTPGARAKLYCSVKCRNAIKWGRKYGLTKDFDRSPKPCERCGDSFVPVNRVQRHCSKSCSKMAENRRRYGEHIGTANYYRTILIEALGGRCEDCAQASDLQVHHRVRLADGGSHTVENIAILCGLCHKVQHK